MIINSEFKLPQFLKQACVTHLSGTAMGIHIVEDLSWNVNSTVVVNKGPIEVPLPKGAEKEPYGGEAVCGHLPQHHMSCYCIMASYANCSVADRKNLQRIIKTAQKIGYLHLLPVGMREQRVIVLSM